MTKKTNTPNPYLIGILIFICGFLAGIGLTVYKMQPLSQQLASAPQASQQQPQVDHTVLHNLEKVVQEDPNNLDAWTQLSHMYFDTNQLDKAINAYTRAIALDPKNADLITDLGVMYRRTDQPQKAIEQFEKAMALNESHEASRFNKGIVLLYDLNDRAGAIASFQKLLEVNPEARSSNGGLVSEFVEYLKDENNKI